MPDGLENERRTTPAADVMRLHRVTGLPISLCQLVLSDIAPQSQHSYVDFVETHKPKWLPDPIECDPAVAAIIKRVVEEVALEHVGRDAMNNATFEPQSSADARPFGSKMGKCHRIWRDAKARLQLEYSVNWRTPAEMNPWIVFD